MLVTQETQDKINKLPLPLRVACNMLLDCLSGIIGGNCDAEQVASVVATMNENSKGRYSNVDLVNYDQACEMLGFARTNRVALKRELDRNGIKQVTMNGHRVGFPKKDVELLMNKRKK